MGGFANNAPIVTDGLVFYVDAGNSSSYPGSGTTWTDLIGSKDGTLTNGPTYSSDNGGSIVFDGTNDYVEISHSQDLTTDSVTVMFFAKTDEVNIRKTFLGFSNGGDYAYKTYCMQTWNGSDKDFQAFSGNNSSYQNYSFDIDGNFTDWNFYCSVITPTNIKTWVNDSLKHNSSSPTFRGSFDRVWIASRGNQYLNGNVSSLIFYNKALTDAEVTQNYNALKNRFV
tara:strand:+ start:382 stop:1059 length:678 start_codon:yes stop_codon:yes gene_type:complete